MTSRMRKSRLIAATLIAALYVMLLPTPSMAAESAAVTGQIIDNETRAPMPGAVVHITDPGTDTTLSSSPSTEQGKFEIPEVPPASYSVAVETEDGVFLVQSAVSISPGENRAVQLALSPGASEGKGMTFWKNPVTASLVVLGAAIVIGLAVDEINDDDQDQVASPFLP